MITAFYLRGLRLVAEVNVIGQYLPANFWHPAEYPEVEITALRCGGLDATFLLDSDELREEIEAAAESAALNYQPELEPA